MSVIWDSGDYKHYYDNGHWHAITGDTPTDILAQIEGLEIVISATPPVPPEEAEPKPPPPTKEQIAEQERQANLAYLASTDWYAIRYAETGKAVPDDILKARQDARDVLSLNKGEPNVSAST